MVRQAGRRNAEAIRAGRVELRLGSVSSLPTFSQPFDKIFTINSIHFWHDPVECLKSLRMALKAGRLDRGHDPAPLSRCNRCDGETDRGGGRREPDSRRLYSMPTRDPRHEAGRHGMRDRGPLVTSTTKVSG